jgi:hypothetical protein
MARKDPYVEFLKEDFNDLFGQMELTPIQRKFLASRWLDQVLWMEKKANQCRDRHYRLRLSAIILGVLVPILIGINTNNNKIDKALEYATIGLSAIVAVSAAVEEFFHYGERWYHYRRTVESLKTYGWQFSQLSGRYAKYPTHTLAFQDFANQVEEVIQRDVDVYVNQVAKSDDESNQQSALVTGALPDIDDLSDSSGDDHPILP